MRFIHCTNKDNKPVMLVLGAGAGIGFHVARRFAITGKYHVCLCRRSDYESLERAVEQIGNEGGSASGILVNVAQPNTVEGMIPEVENRLGPVAVCVYNIGAQIGNRSLEETTYKQFELGWRLGTFGLFRLSKVLLPRMVERGSGVLLVSSATASVRGNAGQHSHAAAMAGRRMLCQTLNAENASKGVHVSHIVVDGAVDSPDTLGKMLGGEKFRALRRKGSLLDPASIADTYWHLAHQPSAWTFELDLRSRTDMPWWNSRL